MKITQKLMFALGLTAALLTGSVTKANAESNPKAKKGAASAPSDTEEHKPGLKRDFKPKPAPPKKEKNSCDCDC
jgi:hypothetical protein